MLMCVKEDFILVVLQHNKRTKPFVLVELQTTKFKLVSRVLLPPPSLTLFLTGGGAY